MTEAELVATALAAGAASGLTDTAAGTVVHDLYDGLKDAVRRRLAGQGPQGREGGGGAGGGYGVRVLGAYESDPDVWRTRLLQALTGCGVERDQEILAAARAVLRAERRTSHPVVTRCAAGRLSGGAARA